MLTIAELPEYIRRAEKLLSASERYELAELVGVLVHIWPKNLKDLSMTKAFDSIKQGLNEAIAHARSKGKATGVTLYTPQAVDVSGLRQRLSLTQEQFAARFGFSVATLRHWERGDRAPSGASLVLLNVIDRNPGAVLEALQP